MDGSYQIVTDPPNATKPGGVTQEPLSHMRFNTALKADIALAGFCKNATAKQFAAH